MKHADSSLLPLIDSKIHLFILLVHLNGKDKYNYMVESKEFHVSNQYKVCRNDMQPLKCLMLPFISVNGVQKTKVVSFVKLDTRQQQFNNIKHHRPNS